MVIYINFPKKGVKKYICKVIWTYLLYMDDYVQFKGKDIKDNGVVEK